MVIIFDGTTEDLLKRLERFSGATQKATLDFMLENFKILTELPLCKKEHEQT